jgi:hypothetical protein
LAKVISRSGVFQTCNAVKATSQRGSRNQLTSFRVVDDRRKLRTPLDRGECSFMASVGDSGLDMQVLVMRMSDGMGSIFSPGFQVLAAPVGSLQESVAAAARQRIPCLKENDRSYVSWFLRQACKLVTFATLTHSQRIERRKSGSLADRTKMLMFRPIL